MARHIEPGKKELGATMCKFREERGLSQKKVADEMMEISEDKLRKFERGEQMPTILELRKFCDRLELTGPEIQELSQFIDLRRRQAEERPIDIGELMLQHKDPIIAPYRHCRGWGPILSLQEYPYLEEGGSWLMSEIELHHNDQEPFELPARYHDEYNQFCQEYYHDERFKGDAQKVKFMVDRNPVAFTDSLHLLLHTRPCRYSEVRFYARKVAKEPSMQEERDRLIEELIRGSSPKAQFAHTLCLNSIIITRDSKILLTKRASKVAYSGGTWLCSADEQLDIKDFGGGPRSIILNLGKRLLKEELKLESGTYDDNDLAVLSVFLETNILNVSLFGHIKLKLDSKELGEHLEKNPPTEEIEDWTFLDLTKENLLGELTQPSYQQYEPTCGYRYLLMYLKNFR